MRTANVKLVVLTLLVMLALTNLGVATPSSYITNVSITNVVFSPDCSVSYDTTFDYVNLSSSFGIYTTVYGDATWLSGGGATWGAGGSGTAFRHMSGTGGGGPYVTCSATVEYRADGFLSATRTVTSVNPEPEQENTPWFFTQPTANDLVTGNHQTVPYNGAEACGIFDAGWYGRKYLTPENFPACAGFLPDGVEVVCMNEEAIWTADNVTGSGVSEGVFYAIVEQHGTCGIFPAG